MKKSHIFFLLLVTQLCLSKSETKGMFSSEIIVKKQLGYVLHNPSNLKEKKPLLIFLVGDGEKGTDVEKVKIHGPFKYLKSHTLDAYVLAPQCSETEYFNSEILYQLILNIQKENNIDSNRIYLTGLSSGGWAVWNLALSHPEMFAAVVPISSYVDLNEQEEACKLKDIPIRIFHGLLDDVVDLQYPVAMYKKLKTCNATDVKLTIFDDENHGCWTRVYDNQDIYDWMFLQIKK